MIYQEHLPPNALRRHVDCFWTLQAEADEPGVANQRIVPDGCPELILNWGTPFAQWHDRALTSQPASFVFGQLAGPLLLQARGRVGALGIRFRPGGAGPLLGPPLAELNGNAVDLSTLWGAAGVELEQRVAECHENAQRIHIASAFLVSRLTTEVSFEDELIGAATSHLASSAVDLPIGRLAEHLGVGRRRLERAFSHNVGLSPRKLVRVLRFQKVIRVISVPVPPDWSGIAADCGYFDQAHLIRDFREFAGLSPAAYLADQQEMAALFAVGS